MFKCICFLYEDFFDYCIFDGVMFKLIELFINCNFGI